MNIRVAVAKIATHLRTLPIAVLILLTGSAFAAAETPELQQLRDQLKKAQDAEDKPAIIELSRRIVGIAPNDSGTWDTLAQMQLESEDLDGLERTGGFGLIAEDVEKVNPDLVVRDKQGKPYSVRYEQVNAMLLNEFLKEHRKVQELEAALETLTARLNEHDAKIQRVSEQIEMKGSATRVAGGQSLKPPCYPNGDNNKEWRALVRPLEISRTGTLALI